MNHSSDVVTARLVSVNVGMPTDVAWRGKTVHTGVYKSPVTGPVMVRRLNIDGDGQGDLAGHGGEQRAVMVYQTESYDYWGRFLRRDDLQPGNFGENFTITGLGDDEVCIGDRYAIGEAEFEVTQPRVTCFRVGMRLGEPDMPNLLVAHHRPGFYFRVITEGRVQAGDAIVRTRRGRHELSVADIDALLYLPDRDSDLLRKSVDVPALSPGWQQSFNDLLAAQPKRHGVTEPAIGVEPGWSGFRRLRVAGIHHESSSVMSIRFEADDGVPLPVPRPGQYLTLRLPDAGDPAPLRSYSLSCYGAEYRISVKREDHGAVSRWLHNNIRDGSVVDVAAPRGDFYLTDGAGPVVLLSAGVGVTPVLAMLHALADAGSTREIWWLHTTRDAHTQAFQHEVSDLIAALPHARQQVFYTSVVRPAGRPCHSCAGAASRCGRVHVRACPVHGRHAQRPDRRGHRPRTYLQRAVRRSAADQSRNRRQVDGAAASASRPRRHGIVRVVLPQRPHGQLVVAVRQHPGVRGGLRRANAILVPKRCLPHVRHPTDRGHDGLHPTSAGAAARRDGADLHRRTARRRRTGPLTTAFL